MKPNPPDLENALRKSFAVIQQLKLELAQASTSAQEPIAIIAMSCRFPGGANSPEAFWQTLREGRDSLSEIPADRWNWQQFYNPDPDVPGTHYVRHGYFIDRVGDFDPEFFGISGREAVSMDPQHRLMLEVSWEALERAALSPTRLRGSRTGVFVGIGQNDYARLQMYGGVPERITPYDGTGISFCFAAARLSYSLGLNGPNLAVDTACSSSLVAMHLACNSLANRECDQALAGGSHLIISPEITIYLSRLKALSPDGRSRAFSADANGYGRGEGCGMLLLKRLSDARRDGDPVLAVIRGSAVNHGGASSGLTVPNGLAQQMLLRDALERARLKPADIGWIEAHGTGTALGDPIEVAALAEIFSNDSRAGQPLYLSSVKTNIGHLEAAAGIAGVIKAVLALQHGELPPHLHLGTANPNIDWQNLPFHIPTSLISWKDPQVAGISAFGLGGTNAHVIIAAAEASPAPVAADQGDTVPCPLLLSARTPEALAVQRDAFVTFLESTDAPYTAIAQTGALGRCHFEYRLGVAACSTTSAATKLRQIALPSFAAGSGLSAEHARIAFLFTGQGSQYSGMGRILWQTEPVFRSAVEHCADLVERAAGWTPLAFIDTTEEDLTIDQTAYTQPTLFTLQVGLVSLWRAWGISPDIVIGHSIGEFAAAWCAGVVSLDDAVRLVVERGRLMQRLPDGGGMAALRLGEADARRAIAPFPTLALAAVNSPQSVSIAGPLAELERCVEQLEQQGVLCQRLAVSHAFHSGLMQPILDDFARVLERVHLSPPRLKFIATGSDRMANVDKPIYWREQIRNTVHFAAAAARLVDADAQVVIEIGPSAPLLALAQQSADLPSALWLPSLERRNPEALADSLVKLYAESIEVHWHEVFAGPRRPAPLPTYPFQRHRCWIDGNTVGNSGKRIQQDAGLHPLLGAAIPSPLATRQYTVVLNARQPAFLADHRVMGEVLYPAAAFIEAALAAASRHFGQTQLRLSDIEFQNSLPLTDDTACRLQLLLTPQAGECAITIHSNDLRTDSEVWLGHMTCTARPLPSDAALELIPVGPGLTVASGADFYHASRERGIDYGAAFQTLQSLETCGNDCGRAKYVVSPQYADQRYLLPPVLFDAALQALAAARPDLGQQTYIPAGITQLDFTPGCSLSGEVRSRIDSSPCPGSALCSLQLCDAAGLPRLAARGVRMQRISELSGKTAPIWLPRWVPLATQLTNSDTRLPSGHWLILGDAPELAAALGQHLRDAGCSISEWPVAPTDKDWPEARGFAAVCYLALYAEPLSTTASRELALIQHLGRLPESEQPALIFVTRGAQAVEAGGERPEISRGALWGLARVARNENPERCCHCVDLDPLATPAEHAAALFIECGALQVASEDGAEDQLAWRQQTRYALRLQKADRATAGPRTTTGRLTCKSIGDLDSLAFADHHILPPGIGEIRVRVHAASLNFKDVLHALGVLALPEHGAFGFDAAGVVEALGPGTTNFAVGDRVMLSLTPGALGDVVNARSEFVCRLPAGLDFATAAALPLAYLTAWYALVHVARLQTGESILIHAAAGGVGQAALAIARRLGAQVHATAHPGKQDHLRRAGVLHIYNSRTADFRDELLAATAGRGVDVVLNCLNGDLISASFDSLKSGGRFVEIGKAGIWPEAMALAYRPDVAYSVFDLADVASDRPALIQQMFSRLAEHLGCGELPPLPVQAFAAEDVGSAFRLISRSRHIGKVVITFAATLAPNGIQLITGGLGALGRLLCQTLVARGEKQFALLVRKDPDTAQQAFLDTLGKDLRVSTYTVNLADATAVQAVVSQIAADFARPISAVYHAAGVLADGTLAQQTSDSFASVICPKLLGAWHLHLATRCHDVQRFVLFSSAAALIGTPGQSSYAVANAGLDALAAARRGAGLPALSVNWGPWAGTGMATRLAETDKQRMSAAGITPLQADLAWNALFQLGDTAISQALVMNVDWPLFIARLPGAASASLVRDLRSSSDSAYPTPLGTKSADHLGLVDRIAAQAVEQRRHELVRQLQQRVASILGRPRPEDIVPTQGFFAMGMDSLTSMELRSGLQRELGLSLPPTLTFDYGSVGALADYLLGQVPAWQAPTTEVFAVPADAQDDLSQLSEAELAEMLTRELQAP